MKSKNAVVFGFIFRAMRSGARPNRSGSILSTLLVVGAVLLGPGWGVQHCAAAYTSTQGPLPNDEVTTSFGAFQIQVDPNFTNLFYPLLPGGFFYPGFSPSSGVLTSPVGFDGSTTIGVSANHNYVLVGGTSPGFPVTIGGAGMSAPLNQITGMSDYYGVPSDATVPNDPFVFPGPLTSPDEVFTEIEAFNLTVSSGQFACGDQRVPGAPVSFDMLTAGPNAGPGAYPGYVTSQEIRSIGKVQQYLAGDYPGASFFDIFVNAFLPSVTGTYTDNAFPGSAGNPPPPPWPVAYPYTFGIAQLTNGWDEPLVIEDTNVMTLPPHVVYIHGQTPAVPIHFKYNNLPYWNAGDLLGYITLAGHGVLECTNHSPGQVDSNCCSVVTTLLDAVLGPLGSPRSPMAVPWTRGTNSFPTPNTTLHSVKNIIVDTTTGATNDLSDNAKFQFNVSTVVAISDLNLGSFSNSIAPPSALGTATYTAPKMGVSFKISFNGSIPIQCTGTGAVSVAISNTALPSAKIYYANPPAGLTNYTVRLVSMISRCTSAAGPFFLRIDPISDNLSVGEETIQKTSGGYKVSFYDDAHFQLSTDGVNYLGAIGNRTMRLLTSLPAATSAVVAPPTIGVALLNKTNILLTWSVGATLQSATILKNGVNVWTDLTGPNTFGPYTNRITATNTFFRLRIP